MLWQTAKSGPVPAAGWAWHCNTTIQFVYSWYLWCAQCHDHPFRKWTQKQFYELAALYVCDHIFAGKQHVINDGHGTCRAPF